MCCKVLERIIDNALVEYLEEHSLLAPEQFRFRGAEDQLLLTYGRVVELVDSGRVVDMIFSGF